MRHLMELLRKEFQNPTDVSTCSAGPDKRENRLLDAFHSHLESRGKEPREEDDLLPFMSFIDTPGHPFVSTSACSPERTISPCVINEDDREKGVLEPLLCDNVHSNAGTSEADSHHGDMAANETDEISDENPEYSDKEFNQDKSVGFCDEQTDELRGLEGQFSEKLHVSSSTHNTAVTEQQAEGSSSDSEF